MCLCLYSHEGGIRRFRKKGKYRKYFISINTFIYLNWTGGQVRGGGGVII